MRGNSTVFRRCARSAGTTELLTVSEAGCQCRGTRGGRRIPSAWVCRGRRGGQKPSKRSIFAADASSLRSLPGTTKAHADVRRGVPDEVTAMGDDVFEAEASCAGRSRGGVGGGLTVGRSTAYLAASAAAWSDRPAPAVCPTRRRPAAVRPVRPRRAGAMPLFCPRLLDRMGIIAACRRWPLRRAPRPAPARGRRA
jgi:hypothetical protein